MRVGGEKAMSYQNTFIRVSEDTKASAGVKPPMKEKPTIASLEYQIIMTHPYEKTEADVQFECEVIRKGMSFSTSEEEIEAHETFFAKPHACFRSSPLVKTYGFGIHYDENGHIMIYGMETPAYQKLAQDEKLIIKKGMRSNRKKKE